MKQLSSEEAYQRLAENPDWVVERNCIYRDFRLKDFKTAIEFIGDIAEIADKLSHHPNILLHEYHVLRITSYTHLVNGISDMDIDLAVAIDRFLDESS
ncbi:MAG: 4a-hydroxytetrahydrobiopterin dehydratase [Nitrospiraceae bacterium]